MAVKLPLADELAAIFARASELLLTEETVSRALELITAAAELAVPGAAGAGVTLIDTDGRKHTASASNGMVQVADECQYRLGQGPCLLAWASGEPVLVSDALHDARWPEWARAAAGLGLRSSVSAPLLAGESALGSVKIYGRPENSFDHTTVRLLELFAAQATIFLINVQARESARTLSEDLRDALAHREIIAVAKGILMARYGLDEDTAMQDLLMESRRARRSLRDVSAELVSSTQPPR
ncbi:GAF and ANTAR domain-containing protein [Arthrobacter sp. NPDC058288]|uniref:GAF and ANTAR domain-containing protein n=1 Tax=Arthrobacter sp. NPDC058288 TaxID=3346424 RepID=UPI0036DFEA72